MRNSESLVHRGSVRPMWRLWRNRGSRLTSPFDVLFFGVILPVAFWPITVKVSAAGEETGEFSAGHGHPVIRGRVESVVDGDTFRLKTASGTKVIDMAGIDAPEKDQPFGGTAAQVLHLKLYQTEPEVLILNEPSEPQLCGIVYLDGCVNTLLVKEGVAWHAAERFPSGALQDAQARAQAAATGIWAAEDPVAPWEWRKQHGSPPDTVSTGRPGQSADPPSQTARPTAVIESEIRPSEDLSPWFRARSPESSALNDPVISNPDSGVTEPIRPPNAASRPGGPYWLTESSKVRHKPTCRYYGKSKGRPCAANEGRPCKVCGG